MQTPKTIRVIINADDLGFSPAVTAGILRAHREGIVTSTTLAANLPAAQDAAEQLATAPQLGVGVHLNFSQGPPLSDEGRRLAGRDGLMRQTAAGLIRACLLRPRLLKAVADEADAQVRWALDHGLRPTHLDSHRHAHAYGPIFARVAEVARRYHIPFIRRHRERLDGPGWPAAPRRGRRVRRLTNWFARRQARIAPELLATTGTWGVAHTGCITAAWLIRAAAALPPGVTEIMVHPGLRDENPAADTRLTDSRQAELDALCDPAVAEAFRQRDIEMTHYGRL